MKRYFFPPILFFLLAASAISGGYDQYGAEKEEILQARLVLPAEKMAVQQSYNFLIEMSIKNEWHINSNKPKEVFLIPTVVKFDDVPGVTFGKIRYMEPVIRKFSFSDTKMSVYEGKVYALSTITISPEVKTDELKISGNIYFQACNDVSCLAPQTLYFSALVPVVENGSSVGQANKALFDAVLPKFEDKKVTARGNEVSKVIAESGLFYTFIFIFLGGLALNLTPCVYPLIPITVSYFGGQSGGDKKALVLRAVIYVLGMSVTYSVLGVLAALTGNLLGSALQNPLVLIFVALVLLALALSMFGLYEIRIPQSLAILGSKNRQGYLGTLFMGLTVGLIAAPCIGPFVLGLLTYVSDLKDPFLGFWMFFVLAMGLGLPFLVLGIFSGAASRLPRSGAWMVWVRNIFGFVLIGMAVYFLEPLFPNDAIYFITLALIALIAGVYLGWLDKNTGGRVFKITRYAVGSVFILIAVLLVLPGNLESGPQINWRPYTSGELQRAKTEGKPVIIDFYADWCIPCKELDKYTFSDPQIINRSAQFVMLKADLTHYDSEETSRLRQYYDIKGVPTIIFLNTDGKELITMRLTGFEDAGQFLELMQQSLP